MILGVAKIDEVLTVSVQVTHPLRVVEAGLIKVAIDQADLRAADSRHTFLGLLVDHDQTIVSGIRNYQQVVRQPLLFFYA
jgi:hypothetical protein